jgi:hypothetical protein
MTLKSKKTRPKIFQDFQSSNQHGTVLESHLKKNVRFMGTVSGPAGYLCTHYYYQYVTILMYIYIHIVDGYISVSLANQYWGTTIEI